MKGHSGTKALQDAAARRPRRQRAAAQDRRSGKRPPAALPGTEARRGEARGGAAGADRGRAGLLPPALPPAGWRSGGAAARPGMEPAPPPPPPSPAATFGEAESGTGEPRFRLSESGGRRRLLPPRLRVGGDGGGQEPPRARGELRSSPLPPSRRTPTSPPRGSAAGCRCLSWKPLSDPPPTPTPGGADSLPGAGRPPWPPAGPRRGEREVRGCGRRGRRAGPSPSPGGLPPRRGAPGGPKRKLAVLPVLPPGPAGAHHRPGGRRKPRPGSAGAGVGAGGSPPGRLRARVLPGSPRPPQRLSQRQTSEVRALLWPRLDNIAGVAAPGGARHPNYLSHKIKDPWGGRGWSVVHCRLF